VEWQEEWGAVQGEILSLYPPLDKDPVSRRRFIVGSVAIIAASLAYPIARYLLYPLSKGMPRLWTRLKMRHDLTTDTPVFVPYKVHRVEGYLEESIRKGVWLIKEAYLAQFDGVFDDASAALIWLQPHIESLPTNNHTTGTDIA